MAIQPGDDSLQLPPGLDLPPGLNARLVSDGRWEVDMPGGGKAQIQATGGGLFRLDMTAPLTFLDRLKESPDADVRTVRQGKSGKYLAWVAPGGDSRPSERSERIQALYAPIRDHLESGALSGQVADDVIGFMEGMASILAEFKESGRAQAVRIAQEDDLYQAALRRKGGVAKLEKNPVARAKVQAKAGALDLWKERRDGKHPKLRTVQQFATEVMRRWPILENPSVICGWSATWTKQVKAGKNPVC